VKKHREVCGRIAEGKDVFFLSPVAGQLNRGLRSVWRTKGRALVKKTEEDSEISEEKF
jgi:hypothetical protein